MSSTQFKSSSVFAKIHCKPLGWSMGWLSTQSTHSVKIIGESKQPLSNSGSDSKKKRLITRCYESPGRSYHHTSCVLYSQFSIHIVPHYPPREDSQDVLKCQWTIWLWKTVLISQVLLEPFVGNILIGTCILVCPLQRREGILICTCRSLGR